MQHIRWRYYTYRILYLYTYIAKFLISKFLGNILFRQWQLSDKNTCSLEEFFNLKSKEKYFKESKVHFVDLIYISYIQRLLRAVPRYLKLKLYNEQTEEGHSEREREGKIYRSIVCWWYIHATGLGAISWSLVEIYQCWEIGKKEQDILVWSLL